MEEKLYTVGATFAISAEVKVRASSAEGAEEKAIRAMGLHTSEDTEATLLEDTWVLDLDNIYDFENVHRLDLEILDEEEL